jgi:hypothetical protein
MNRNDKIKLLQQTANGNSFIDSVLKTIPSMPSWVVNEFETVKELERQLCEIFKCKGRVYERENKCYFVPSEPIRKKTPNWFNE